MQNALFSGSCCILPIWPGICVGVSSFVVRRINSCFSSVFVVLGVALFGFSGWVLVLSLCLSPMRVVWWIVCVGGRSYLVR